MSNPLALAGVTAVLQHYLHNAYTGTVFGGTVKVSAKAPDIVQQDVNTGSANTQINLFLHQVTHNVGWRNQDLPSMSSDGKSRLKNPPLALDLHYLLTAYGSDDCEAEGLLGYAVLLLHQSPVLTRNDITQALGHLPSNPLFDQLHLAGLADQVEMIKITPSPLGREEMAWLWTALKADYRPTFPFQVSVVLIDPQFASASALPVLSRNISVQAGPPPLLFALQLAQGQTAPAQGDTVTATGQSLTGASLVALSNPQLGINYAPFAPVSVTNASLSFKVPTDTSGLPAGVYSLSVLFKDGSGNVVLSTNTLSMGIAPTVSGTPTATNNPQGTLVTLKCAPDVRPSQTVSLSLGGVSAPAQTFDTQTNSLSFQFPTLPAGKYLIRLQVDGVDSPIQVDWTAKPLPKFLNPFLTI